MKNSLKFQDKVVLAVGKWNGVDYSADLIEEMVKEINSLDEVQQDKVLSIFNDHRETIDTWVGRAVNLRWDDKKKAALADLEIVDENTIKKLKFQIEEQKKIDWGISPSLNLVKDHQGKTKKISLRNLSLVIEPAQGEKTGLEKTKGGQSMLQLKIEDLEGKTPEELKEASQNFIAEMQESLKIAKKKIEDEEPEEETMTKELDGLSSRIESLKGKFDADSQGKLNEILGELKFLGALVKKFKKAPYDKKGYKYPYEKGKYEASPILRLLFQSDKNFEPVKDRLFRKELIKVGSYLDPRDMKSNLEVTRTRINGWIENFGRGLKRVPVPIRHSEDPFRNTGWLVKLALEGDSLMGFIDFTNAEAKKLISEGSIKDASISLDPDYIDAKTGIHHGETIDHVALTISPHITNMAAFEPIAAERPMEIIEFSMFKGQGTQSSDPVVKQLLESNQALHSRILSLERERDEGLQDGIKTRVEKLVGTGRLTPGLKNRVLELSLGSRDQVVELEKGKKTNLSEEILSILEGINVTFEMAQRAGQTSEVSSKRYLSEEDFAKNHENYGKLLADGKIKMEDGTGRAYWVS